jgi:4-amino-4-deoxy-L-arabinose transferase-like glycosyltransferase
MHGRAGTSSFVKFSDRAGAVKAVSQPDRVWLIAVWVIVTAYNLFKPYHIDDTAHLEVARWISAHPLHPMSGVLNWRGTGEPISQLNQPHLYFYLLALWGRVFGYGEAAMHAMQSLAALACILLFYRLGRALAGPMALWATAMLILGPAFIVEQNLMVDVPLLAAWLAFFTPLICDIDSPHQNRRYGLAALACAAAMLIKYNSLVLLPILGLSLLLERRKAQAWTILIPLAVLGLWSLFNFLDYGAVHIATRPLYDVKRHGLPLLLLLLTSRAVAWVLALGALTPLGLIAWVQHRKLVRAETAIYAAAFVGFAATILAVASGVLPDWRSDRLLWVVFILNGSSVLLALVPDVRSVVFSKLWRPETGRALAPTIYLLLWILSTTAFFVVFSPSSFISPRYVLLILPALTLLLVARWDGSLSRASKIAGLAFTAIVSAGLCISD